jgi:LmbE family N-acetylglucosaminyl deacetylase
VTFLGAAGARVPDGQLVNALPATWSALEELTRGWAVDEVLCPAYEGGHMDHDAANVLAIALAGALGVPGGARQFPLYNGWGTRGGLFRVMHPSPGMGEVGVRRVTVRDGFTVAMLVRHYRSQRKTWLGLSPEAFLKLVAMRREYSSVAEPAAVLGRPHPGPLFYERRFGFDYDEWRRGADAFVAGHAPWQPAVPGP